MKKLMSILLGGLLLLTAVPAMADAKTGLENPHQVSGEWTISGSVIDGGGNGNVFCMSDSYMPAGSSWSFSADAKTVSGNAIGIVFGVTEKDQPSKRWHCLNIGQDGNYTAMFRETESKNDYIISRGLTETEKNAEFVTLRVDCLEGKTINGYCNDVLVYSYKADDFEGGYFGVMACSAQAEFKNIKLEEITMPKLKSLSVPGIEFDLPFSPDENEYWGVTSGKSVALVNAEGDNCTVTINGSTNKTAVLNVGLTTIKVKAEDEHGVGNEYRINIVRRLPEDKRYNETSRPQLRFSPELFSINDPNGLVYDSYTDEYHLFFQCDYAFRGYVNAGDTKSWGHAVSKDLINWQETDLAITPDENGVIWSGSAVIDKNNTSGLFDDSTPEESRMVFMFTYFANGRMNTGLGNCSIGMAYSKDHCKTFIKYGPVIKNEGNKYGSGLRDPKVIWYENSALEGGGIWVAAACGDQGLLFTSKNLIDWELSSKVGDLSGKLIATECPDLFPLKSNDGQEKWVFCAAGTWYMIGELTVEDGKVKFVPETELIYPVDGVADLWPGSGKYPENYAAQTFYNTDDGRRIQISWTRDFLGSDSKAWWNSDSIPTEIRLENTKDGLRLAFYPIKEWEGQRKAELFSAKNKEFSTETALLEQIKAIDADLLQINAVLAPGTASEFGFKLKGGTVTVKYKDGKIITDKSLTNTSGFVYDSEVELKDGKINLSMIVDTVALDVYCNGQYHGGYAYAAFRKGIEFFTDGTVTGDIEIYELNPIDRGDTSDKNTAAPTAGPTAEPTDATTEPTQPTSGPTAGTSVKNNTLFTLIISILAGLAICAGVFVIIRGRNAKKKQ